MVRNRIFWTIGEQLYIVYYPVISDRKIKFIGLKNGYGKIPLEQWCHWDESHIHKYYGTYCTRKDTLVGFLL